MKIKQILPLLLFPITLLTCNLSGKGIGTEGLPSPTTIGGYTVANESVLRAIPENYIDLARNQFSISYDHTSHGTHVTYGLNGLKDYKSGDDTLFGITINSARVANKLDFHDNYGNDLSQSDNVNDAYLTWKNTVRTYLDNDTNDAINIMIWSWCDISGHSVPEYLAAMEVMMGEYGAGGSKIGTSPGQTKTTPVTFIFMTGHATQNNNINAGRPKAQADLIVDFCKANDYWCIDYFSIESHDMNDNYYSDVGEDSDSSTYGGNFFTDWQNSHTLGVDYFHNLNTGNSVAPGSHVTQHITSNRKAYATWYILARIAGWDGNSE